MSDRSTSATEQQITGWKVGIDDTAFCQYCKSELHEGVGVTIYAYRPAGEHPLSVARLYCSACEYREVSHPALGCYEWLAEARLALTSDVALQSHHLTLIAVEIIDQSGPRSGDAL